jgi:hypothetical protein
MRRGGWSNNYNKNNSSELHKIDRKMIEFWTNSNKLNFHTMNIEIDIKEVKLRAKMLVDIEDEERFDKFFDGEQYLDVIANPEDYIAEGLVNQFYNLEG